ncbi:sensor histidine kinase [Aliikangiella sp. G2MR2-5]|uniref:sensor histidine kinase n=1 Tax=Aliikangiella sp. G2MR2-5 TaxID=2788943 RepID=UPI0018ABA92C|nr:histidine kinase [Aliikangiella sp. G2MR2-5]
MINTKKESKEFFLPDFCQVQSVFFVILIAELLAVVFTLLNFTPQGSLWQLLGVYSISIQLVCLFSTASLCLIRPYLARFEDWVAGLMGLLVIVIITLLFNIIVIKYYWLQSIDLANKEQSYFIIQNLFISGLIGAALLRYFYLQAQYRKQLLAESSARLQALQARIRPHFLFNSMNVIASLTRIDPEKAEAAIEDLSDLFRASLNVKEDLIPFSQELKNGMRYLAIEQLRLGQRLKIEEKIDHDSLDVLVPPLTIQPLLENAVYHGIQCLPEGGVVVVQSAVDKHNLVITITNPVVEGKTIESQRKKGNGMALDNIRERLQVIYNGKAQFHCDQSNGCFQVTMLIPCRRD